MAARAVAEPTYQTAWIRQFGTSSDDLSHCVSADGLGNVYLSGYTGGSLGGPHAGGGDAFLAKLVVPEPGTLLLLAAGGLCMLLYACRKRRRR